MAILISDDKNIDLKTFWDSEAHSLVIKRFVHHQENNILHIYAPNEGPVKYLK